MEKRSETHLIIIWSKALNKKEKIVENISENFEILDIYNVTWSKKEFSANLSRFYGENLPKNSDKEAHCGNGTFSCIIVRDNDPQYKLRETSKGLKLVNSNLFDLKKIYRKWTGGGHKIHATDNTQETKFQLFLLINKTYAYYQIKDIKTPYSPEKEYKNDLIGCNGWDSFEDVFKALDENLKYVVLRNFENLNAELNALHPDIDLLIDNKKLAINVLNAVSTTSKKYRVQHTILINKKKINFDFRYVGDNYYCYKWERDILKNRIPFKSFYIPNKINYFHSLLYHMYIHKRGVSSDYMKKLIMLSNQINMNLSITIFANDKALNILYDYMLDNNYMFTDPKDLTVYYNQQHLIREMLAPISIKRIIKNKYLAFRQKGKKFVSRF